MELSYSPKYLVIQQVFDNTSKQTEKFNARSPQIATELFHVFSKSILKKWHLKN